MASLKQIRDTLKAAAEEIHTFAGWPVSVDHIMERLGIRLRIIHQTDAGASARLEISNGPEIIVSQKWQTHRLTDNRARFSVAHEIGHWIVWRKLGYLPSKETYWVNEDLCNEFASCILIPTLPLKSSMSNLVKEGVPCVLYPLNISRQSKTSWDVSARAITARSDFDCAYLRLMECPTNHVSSSNRSDTRFLVSSSSLTDGPGAFIGQRAVIRNEDLAEVLTTLAVGKITQVTASVTIGRLQFTRADCEVFRESARRWTLSLRMSSDGAVILPQRTPRARLSA